MSSPLPLPRRETLAPSVLESCLREAQLLPGVDSATCRWLEEKLGSRVFNLVVAGEFKRGKSSVINALLADPLLPVGVVPLTSVVTIIRAGPSTAIRVELKSGEHLSVDRQALGDYVTERGNPGNTRGVERVVIDHPSPWLASGVRLVDTPGIGSVYGHNTDETRRYLPQADAVLFITSVDQPVSRTEIAFLQDLAGHAEKIFCLLNKTDYLSPEELRESLEFSTVALGAALGTQGRVFPVSARLGLDGRKPGNSAAYTRSGFRELEQALQRFMESEKNATWLRSLARSFTRLLMQARLALDLESRILTQPLEQIEAGLAAFRAAREKAEHAQTDHGVLLEADATRVLKEDIEPRLEAFKREQQIAISAQIAGWLEELKAGKLPSRTLQAQLEKRMVSAIRSAYDGWLAREDAQLSQRFDALCARFWTKLQASADELMRRSSELFAIDFQGIQAESHWSRESGFYYKFWHEPTSLQLLSSSALLALPAALAGPIIVRRMKATAADVIEVQAGRIRYDIETRLKLSVRDAQRQMLAQNGAAIAAIQSAIDRGIATRQASAGHAARRGAELDELRQRIAHLEQRIGDIVPSPHGTAATHPAQAPASGDERSSASG